MHAEINYFRYCFAPNTEGSYIVGASHFDRLEFTHYHPSVSATNVRFTYYLFIDADVKLKIFNLSGQLISQQKATQFKGDNKLTLKDTNLKGVFIYHLLRKADLAQRKIGKNLNSYELVCQRINKFYNEE